MPKLPAPPELAHIRWAVAQGMLTADEDFHVSLGRWLLEDGEPDDDKRKDDDKEKDDDGSELAENKEESSGSSGARTTTRRRTMTGRSWPDPSHPRGLARRWHRSF